MKRSVIRTTIFSFLISISLCSCNPLENWFHQHTFADRWSCDEEYHWIEATCGHDVIANKEPHNFVDTVLLPTEYFDGYTIHRCSKCGFSYLSDYTTYNPDDPDHPIPINPEE